MFWSYVPKRKILKPKDNVDNFTNFVKDILKNFKYNSFKKEFKENIKIGKEKFCIEILQSDISNKEEWRNYKLEVKINWVSFWDIIYSKNWFSIDKKTEYEIVNFFNKNEKIQWIIDLSNNESFKKYLKWKEREKNKELSQEKIDEENKLKRKENRKNFEKMVEDSKKNWDIISESYYSYNEYNQCCNNYWVILKKDKRWQYTIIWKWENRFEEDWWIVDIEKVENIINEWIWEEILSNVYWRKDDWNSWFWFDRPISKFRRDTLQKSLSEWLKNYFEYKQKKEYYYKNFKVDDNDRCIWTINLSLPTRSNEESIFLQNIYNSKITWYTELFFDYEKEKLYFIDDEKKILKFLFDFDYKKSYLHSLSQEYDFRKIVEWWFFSLGYCKFKWEEYFKYHINKNWYRLCNIYKV